MKKSTTCTIATMIVAMTAFSGPNRANAGLLPVNADTMKAAAPYQTIDVVYYHHYYYRHAYYHRRYRHYYHHYYYRPYYYSHYYYPRYYYRPYWRPYWGFRFWW